MLAYVAVSFGFISLYMETLKHAPIDVQMLDGWTQRNIGP